MYDAIIIGAGIGGLVCGCYLAKAGMKVLICEQHNKPGGYCTSFRRGPFIFDAAAHSFGSFRNGGTLNNIFKDLGISECIKIIRFDPSDVIITNEFKVGFYNDINMTIKSFSHVFPKEEENIKSFFSFIKNFSNVDTIKYRQKTFKELLEKFFTDKKLINVISIPVFGNSGLPPSQLHAFTGSRILMEFLIDGGYYPVGGMQTIPDVLVSYFIKNGGEIIFNSLVTNIICENGKVSGIKLANGSLLSTNCVIAACDITNVFKNMIDSVPNERFVTKISNMIPSISTFILYLGLNYNKVEYPHIGTNVWYTEDYDIDSIYLHMKNCDFKKINSFMFRISHDKKTLLAFSLASFQNKHFWKENKQRFAEHLISLLGKMIPGIKQHIVYIESATPQTLWRYTLNRDGANYGWAPTVTQLFDPNFKIKTFVDGLYITGHWTAQTHGIPGVAYLGYNTAQLILKKF